jgi:uncharacterized protein YukE
MRALASSLRRRADQLDATASRTVSAVKGTDFQGAAANRLHDRIDGWGSDVRSAASELVTLAGVLERSAATVEQAQERYRAMVAAERAREADAARRP